MEHASGKTSTGLALRNPAFSKLWLAMVISGSCVAAQNTALYWALNALGATTVLISLMTTVSALPATLFTLLAGALADMLDRKTILLAVQRKRRSREEVRRLVVEFEASGSRPAEFCRNHGLALSTLQRHCKRQRLLKLKNLTF